ncbi:hypothetical protein BDZ45DRAFT_715078 [Acephala macrosclerotiorum]|nr:hypothetical protein BDZ45DRAFT_715078 [Acephala macrosclerotiorum]
MLFEASAVVAFPDMAKALAASRLNERIAPVAPFPEHLGSPSHALYGKLDAAPQPASASDDHALQAPGPGGIRCSRASLNAAANHRYLPCDGIATAETVNTGLWEAFGLDKTATFFLQTATMFFDDDPVSGRWSIGYHSDKTQSLGIVGDLSGNETGICAYSHLEPEGDASIARELLDLAKTRTGGNLTPQVMAEHQHNRKQRSITTNPKYFSPAYAGIAFTFGAHMFAYQLLTNHSTEYPRDDDAWTLTDILISTAQQRISYPSNCQVGGNTGEVNSFSGVDLGDITSGLVSSASDLSDPERLGCFISQAIRADVPSLLDNVISGVALTEALGLVDTMLMPALAGFGSCPNLPAGKSVMEYEKRSS